MENVFFSIVIPTYNRGNFLKKALNSVFNQTFKNFEVIIVDSNSNDNTDEIISNFKKEIIVKKIEKKGNISASRNLGIKFSKGKWIAFLDSDDLWSENKLEVIFKLIQKHNSNVFCNSEWILDESNINKKKIWHYGPFTKNFYEILLRYGNRMSTSATIVEKNFLIKNDLKFNETGDFSLNEDFDFFLNLAKSNAIFKFIYSPLGTHVFNETSIMSTNSQKRKEDLIKVLKLHTFKIQNFTKDKNILWNDINIFIALKEKILKVRELNINWNIIKEIFYISLKNPKIFLVILSQFLRLRFYQFRYLLIKK